MSNRAYPKHEELPPSYLRALWAFYTYTRRMQVTPSQSALAEEIGLSKSAARQAIDYLTARGYLFHTGVSVRPWIITELGKKTMKRTSK